MRTWEDTRAHPAPTLQAFFTDRLIAQRQCSGQTIAAYRYTWELVLAFASGQLRKPPSRLQVADLDAPLIGAFLRHPDDAAVIAWVPAIPPKRTDRAP